MEYSALFVTFLFISFLLKLAAKFRSGHIIPHPRLPPGPRKLPLIGNIHHLAGNFPHRALTGLAKIHGPLMHLQMGEIPVVVASSPEIATEFLRTHDINFSSKARTSTLELVSYNCSNIGFSPYGESWRQLRKIVTSELLCNGRVRSFRSVRDEETSNLVKWIAGKAETSVPINLTEKINLTVYGITARTAIDLDRSQQESFIGLAKEAVRLGVAFKLVDLFPSFKILEVFSGFLYDLRRVYKELDKILCTIIDEHRRKEVDRRDIVDVLLKYHEDVTAEFSPTIDNIKAVILEIFAAGSEAPATLIDWAMSEMMKNPETMIRAQEEVRRVFTVKGYVDEEDFDKLKYLKSVIKETLRLRPPVPLLFPRLNTERCEIGGYEIPAKTSTMVNVWAINRDPKHWGSDAELFKPERFLDSAFEYRGTNFEFIPFGAGRRMCPGITFGTANVELMLAKLLYHFDWILPGGVKSEDLDMAEAPGFTINRKENLHVLPVIRNPPSLS